MAAIAEAAVDAAVAAVAGSLPSLTNNVCTARAGAHVCSGPLCLSVHFPARELPERTRACKLEPQRARSSAG